MVGTLEVPPAPDQLYARDQFPIIKRGQRITLACPVCSAEQGKPVVHQWKLTGGTPLPDVGVRIREKRRSA